MKLPFSKRLARVWQDLQNEQKCKYEELSPARLLERLNLLADSRENDELTRANWFWGRRPRVLTTASYLVWLIVIAGLPFWLFSVPVIGLPLIVILLMMVNIDIVQSLRWRRQYELSIDRLIGTSTNGRDTFRGFASRDQLRSQQ
ncbi:MAG: hypothetical protein JOZ08_16230 [Verrucomicrobia bacterium]|nr:hypothetical protein [Verrucomicrobiota bacterium]